MKHIKISQPFSKQIPLMIFLFLLTYALSPFYVIALPTTQWTFATKGQVWSSPTLNNGILYIGSDDFNLYALYSTTGTMKWKFTTGGLIRCTPAVVNGTVYFASDDGNLYAADTMSGTEKWHFNIGNKIPRILPENGNGAGNTWDYMQSSPAIIQGTVYIGSGDSSVYAVDAQTGILKWKIKTGGIIRSTPCVEDTVVYVGSFDGFIYALSANTGSLVWRFNASGSDYQAVQPSPRVVNGILYCGSRHSCFYAINARTGQEIWNYSYSGSWVESSAIVVNGVVYVGSSDLKTVFAFDAQTGNIVWKCSVIGYAWSTPTYNNGTIYIGNINANFTAGQPPSRGYLYAINATTGKEYWHKFTGPTDFLSGVFSSPIVFNGTVYYGSLDSLVYAVSSDTIPYVNRALGKKVSASSSSSSANLPDKAVDGNLNTFWKSAISDPQWMMVDLNSVQTINHVILKWQFLAAKEYQIQTSLDSINWTTVFAGTNISGNELVFGPVSAKYVRMNGTQRQSPSQGYTIKEFEIYDQSGTTTVNTSHRQINSFTLEQNYPNPFNPSTKISFILQKKEAVTLAVFDLLGREITTIIKGELPAGSHTHTFNAGQLPSGVYFYRIATPEKVAMKKMILIK
jgi:eukaryotic-like serine/threonine-protein kinase